MGGARLPARPTRAGVLRYVGPDGKVQRLWRRPSDVFDARSLASLRGAPVTIGHPREFVGLTNYGALAKGHVLEVSETPDEGGWVAGVLDVNDADTIGRLGKDLVELSAAYDAVSLDETPGTTPDGEAYDAIQVGPYVYNHVALLPYGGARAGRGAVVLLDAEETMMTRRYTDAVDPPPDAPAEKPAGEWDAKAAFDELSSAVAALRAELAALKPKDAADKPADAPVKVQDSADFESRLRVRRALERAAEKVLTSYTDSLTTGEIIAAAAKQLRCPVGSSDDYVAGALHAAATITPPTVRLADNVDDNDPRTAALAKLRDQRVR